MFIHLLDQPFYSGSSSTTEIPYPFPIALGGHGYNLDTTKYSRETVDVLRQAFDQGGEAGEQTLSVEGYWRRTCDDWSFGAGQTYWDRQGANRGQFLSSKGIDCFSTVSDLTLLNDTRRILDSAATNLKLLKVGNYLYVADGQNLRYTSNPELASPTWTAVTGLAAASIIDMCTDGNRIWLSLTGAGVYTTTAGAASATLLDGTTRPQVIAYANGNLVGGIDNVAVTIDAAGADTAITGGTMFNTNFRFAAVTGTATSIVFGGNTGDHGQLFTTTFSQSTGGLAALVPAGRLPDGELIVSLAAYAGFLLIGTSKGFRITAVSDTIQPGPLVSIGRNVSCFEPQEDSVWFGWSNYDGVSTGLGQMRLSDFTAPFVPAYASDLMASTQGTVTSVATFGTRRYFTVSGSGVWAEYSNKVASGTVDSGWIGFSTPEPKVVANLELRHAPLVGSIAAAIVTEAGAVRSIGASTTPNTLAPVSAFSCQGESVELMRVQLTLTRDADDATKAPVLRRWTLRVVAAPSQVEQFVLPIMLYERIDNEIGDGADFHFDPYQEWLFLKGLEDSRSPVLYQEGSASYLVTVRNVGLASGDARGWDSDRSFVQGTWTVRVITLAGGV